MVAPEPLPGFTLTPGKKPTVLRKLLALLGYLLIPVLMGGLLALPPLMVASGAAQVASPAVQVWKEIPDDLPTIAIAQRNIFFDKNGKAFAQVWEENRVEVDSLAKISFYAKQGLIDTEDKRFYEHKGFDLQGTARAAYFGGGGSGITQQLIKNLQFYNLLTAGDQERKEKAVEKSYGRKLKELKTALKYEKTHSKDEILLEYFNTVAFGSPTTYGIETASRKFFNKAAKDLTLAEAAVLVGSAQNPAIYNLSRPANEHLWKKRQEQVIARLLAEGHVTPAQAQQARKAKIVISTKPVTAGSCEKSSYPFYCKYVLSYLLNSPRVGDTAEQREAIVARGGLKVHTHLDPAMLTAIDKYLKASWGTSNRIVNPVAVVQPGTGGVIAFAQNRDYGSGKGKTQLSVPSSPVASGSVYKMITLAAALNSGRSESSLQFSSACPLKPGKNYDAPAGGFVNSVSCALQGGELNYKEATAYSSNTWFVTLEMAIGVNAIKTFSKAVGLAAPESITPRSLSYTLGPVENSSIRTAAAFATFANRGVYCPATPVKSITLEDGRALPYPDKYDPLSDSCRAVISPKNSGIVLKAMRANMSGEVKGAFGMRSAIKGQDTVGKSGTNGQFNSSWVHVAAPYVVYSNVFDMNRLVNGIDGAVFKGKATAWHDNTAQTSGSDIMKLLLQGKKSVPLPYESSDTTLAPQPTLESLKFTMPSVMGMAPGAAVKTLEELGMIVHVSKEKRALPPGYSSGTVVEQSVAPGEKLSQGATREVVLHVGN